MGRVANAAHNEQPADSYQLRRACPEVLKLCVNIKGIREQLSWALNGDSADAIDIHHKALLSEVEWIEGAAAREARARRWDLNLIEGLVQGESTKYTLRSEGSTSRRLHGSPGRQGFQGPGRDDVFV